MQNIQLNLNCAICKQATKPGDRVKLSEKGCSGIHSASRERGDNLQVTAGQVVHAKCPKDYTHPNCIAAFKPSEREGTPSPVKKRRSLRSHRVFDFKAQCLFCCQSTEHSRNRKEEKLIPVRTDCFKESILKACAVRGGDDKWANEVYSRLAFASDCCAYDVVDHNVCSTNFRKGSGIPQTFSDEPKGKKPIGRPENPVINRSFQDMVKVLEYCCQGSGIWRL